MKKRTITVELCDKERTYEGRLLGLIDDNEFHCIMKNRSTQNKIYSSETIPLKEITDNFNRLKGLRLVISLRKVDGKNIPGKRLFISEKLSYITHQSKNEPVGILGEEDEYYEVTES